MRVHLSGICGTAMASLAGLLREQGHVVTGSDQDVYPPMSTQLEALGIEIRSPYAEANVSAEADLVVIGNALSRGNPEVEVVLDRKQRMTSLPALVGETFLQERTSLVVAGTHGKTTTTSLLAWLLDRGGLDPSFLVGGVPVDFGRSYRLGRGRHFVIEGDEYDCAFFDKRPKFVHYRPDVAVIGNVEHDHADIYPDLDAVQTAFLRLLAVIPRRGLLIAGVESPALVELLPRAPCRVETFGLAAGADWRAVDVRRVVRAHALPAPGPRGQDEGEFSLGLLGDYNVRNALAALAAAQDGGARSRGLSPGPRGVQGGEAASRDPGHRGRGDGLRRLRAPSHGGPGHPRGAAGQSGGPAHGSGSARGAARGRLRAPVLHLAHAGLPGGLRAGVRRGRRGGGLRRAPPGKVPERERLSEAELVAGIRARGTRADFVPEVDAIVARLVGELREGDRVVILSNGGFGGLHEKLLAGLRLARESGL